MAEPRSSIPQRKIIHIDMDAFFASVEQRDNPDYRGKPVAVGGAPENRGVVAAASYEARSYGIHSAMPSRTAVRLCPSLIFVRPRFDVYKEVSGQIREIFLEYTDLVEPLSLDEAYLDVTENKFGMPSATLIAREIKERIKQTTGLTASAGVSVNKFLAKTASAVRKPDGLYLIPPEKAESFVLTLPVEKFYGIGDVTAAKMHRLGIFTGADLKTRSEAELLSHFGKAGAYYYRIVRGEDDRPVTPNRIRKSIGAEESYARDLKAREEIVSALDEVAQTLCRRVERTGGGRTVTLKVKYGDYQNVSRSRTLAESISTRESIMSIALELLATTEAGERSVRLLGLALSNLDSERESDDFVQLSLPFS
ncbi:MAG: DNA polymerase IV [Cyanobacteria bacterium HKST-UBA02]|nr:DNA polymerase IV [Cyanobacteria bacterium HKST-UBA02]